MGAFVAVGVGVGVGDFDVVDVDDFDVVDAVAVAKLAAVVLLFVVEAFTSTISFFIGNTDCLL